MTSRVTVSAPAKLTMSLIMTGIRDDGYHLIDAEMVSLAIADTLTIDPTGDGLEFTGPYRQGLTADDSNLVRKALRLVGRTAHVTVDKQIPHGGGLGGGSTDAAAILRWAGVTDLNLAASIGADVPFCLVGGRARVGGIGDQIEPLEPLTRDLTLVIPPLQVATPAAYRAYDRMVDSAVLAPRTRSVDLPAVGDNDLEAAAVAVEPQMARWRDLIWGVCGQHPNLAGSGATWYVLGKHGNALAELVDEGAHVTETHTVAAT